MARTEQGEPCIPVPDWVGRPVCQKIASALGADNIRFVGGAVRDSILGVPITDIDVATSLRPELVTEKLTADGVKVIPTGVKHGTVTAVFNHESVEVTTLRVDVRTDGRRAEVAFTGDWYGDAARRDLTMNALYLAVDGRLYDPFGGLTDLRAGRIRFIGDADRRIEEDALRILRYFRFYAHYGREDLEPAALAACQKNSAMLDDLSGERIWVELKKLATGPNLLKALEYMTATGVLTRLGLYPHRATERLAACPDPYGVRGLTLFMLLLEGAKAPEKVTDRMHMSRKEQDILRSLTQAFRADDLGDIKVGDIKRALYRYGYETVYEISLLRGDRDAAETVRTTDMPVFPLLGRDLLAAGLPAGKQMGQKLGELEETWVASGFTLSRTDLLRRL